MHILGKLTECIAEPREDYKPCVPRIVQIVIPQDMIGPVIGPGGKVIQDIQKTTNTTITITEVDNKGIVDIFGIDKEALDGALARIKAIVAIPEVGETYHGKVRSIVAFGAFVEIMPGKDALLHISETPRPTSSNCRARRFCPSLKAMWNVSAVRVPSAVSVANAATAANAGSATSTKRNKKTVNVDISDGKKR